MNGRLDMWRRIICDKRSIEHFVKCGRRNESNADREGVFFLPPTYPNFISEGNK